MIYKVDRIVTVEEALLCEKNRINYVGVCIKDKALSEGVQTFKSGHSRTVTLQKALEIRSNLSSTEVVFELENLKISASCLQLLREYNINYLQLLSNVNLDGDDLINLHSQGTKLFITGEDIDPDYDPSWLIPPKLKAEKKDVADTYIQIDIYPDSPNSLDDFLDASRTYPECLQIQEIEDIAKKYNIILSTDFTPENIIEISNMIPSAFGVYFTLKDKKEVPKISVSDFELEEIFTIKRSLEQSAFL